MPTTSTSAAPLDPAAVVDVPCDQPHDVEVAAVFEYPAGPGSTSPAPTPSTATPPTSASSASRTTSARRTSTRRLDVAFVAPGEDGWEDGDRRIACVLYHIDFAPLTGSVAGTGL